MVKRLVIICGAPGSGKSTISKELARATGSGMLAIDEFIFTMNPGMRLSGNHAFIERLVRVTAEQYLLNGRSLIIEGAMVAYRDTRPFNLDAIIRSAERRGYHIIRIHLTASVRTCAARMRGRQFVCSPETVRNVRAALDAYTADWLTVSTDSKQVANVVQEILDMPSLSLSSREL